MHMLSVSIVRRIFAGTGEVAPYWEFVSGAMLSIGVASLSYWTFERYFLRLKDRWFADKPTEKSLEVAPSLKMEASSAVVAPGLSSARTADDYPRAAK